MFSWKVAIALDQSLRGSCFNSVFLSMFSFFLITIYWWITLCISCGIEKETRLEDDEQLARALQESLIVDSRPEPWSRNDTGNGYGYGSGYDYEYGYGNDNLYQPISFPYSTSFRYIMLWELRWHWQDQHMICNYTSDQTKYVIFTLDMMSSSSGKIALSFLLRFANYDWFIFTMVLFMCILFLCLIITFESYSLFFSGMRTYDIMCSLSTV